MPDDPQPSSPLVRQHPLRKKAEEPRRYPWLSLFLVSGMILGTYACLEFPAEIGRWHLAAAVEHWTEAEFARAHGEQERVKEQRDLAFAKLENALRWSSDNAAYLAQRAAWKSQAGNYEEALADINLAIQQAGEKALLLKLRATIYQHLGKHAEAVADHERINNLSKTSGNPRRNQALNELAYSKALGKIDLPSALAEAEEALSTSSGIVGVLVLDTRGFVQFQLGKDDQALNDLNEAVRGFEQDLDKLANEFEAKRMRGPDERTVDIELLEFKENYAAIFYHRALVHERLGHTAAAAADRKRVKELLGREGDERLF